MQELSDVVYLKNLKQLRVLWLNENPCANNEPHYRHKVLAVLQQLKKLDDSDVTPDELHQAKKSNYANEMENKCMALQNAQQQQQVPQLQQVQNDDFQVKKRNKWQEQPVAELPIYSNDTYEDKKVL